MNNTPIAGANSINYTPTVSGIYTIEVDFSNGCPTLSPPYSFSLTSANNNYNFNQKVHLYPNPTSKSINLEITTIYDEIIIKVRDLSGKLITTKKYYSTNNITFEMDQAAGIYLIEVINQEGSSAEFKVVKR